MAVSIPSDYKMKKMTTKHMIIEAMTELNRKKGVSLQAIKKFLSERYNVDIERVNFLIKKCLKAGVDDGTFTQVRGIGISGSFKLTNVKEKLKKEPKKSPEETKTETENVKKEVTAKVKVLKNPKTAGKEIKKKITIEEGKRSKPNNEETENVKKKSQMDTKMAKPKNDKLKASKDTKTQMKIMQTPKKKRAAMAKRKSLGSIKRPKMKPSKN